MTPNFGCSKSGRPTFLGSSRSSLIGPYLLHSFRVYFLIFPLVSSVFSPFRALLLGYDEQISNLLIVNLHVAHPDLGLFSAIFSTRFEFVFTSSPPVSSVVLHLLNSFRVCFHTFSTRFECVFISSPLVSSVFSHLLHSFRVCFHTFSTRFECVFTPSPLVSSVFSHL
jgi:hypothetical protein